MNKKEFYQKVKEELTALMDENVTIKMDKVTKNNGLKLDCVIISREGSTISPNIYLNDLYLDFKNGLSMETIVQNIISTYEARRAKDGVDLQFFYDYKEVKKRLACKLIHREKNLSVLKKVPHVVYQDLALVFYYLFGNENLGSASILIHDKHVKMWGISKEELQSDAVCNTPVILPPRIRTMEEVMRGLFIEDLKKEFDSLNDADGGTRPNDDWYEKAAGQMVSPMIDPKAEPTMFVAGNEEKLFGAAVLLYDGLMENFSKQINSSFFILPCSVHELILIPDNGMTKENQLKEMVCEVNATQVEPEDFLSDSVYYYSKESGEIRILC